MQRPRITFAAALTLVAALLLATGLIACGGGSDEDPAKVLDETFSSGKDYSKGKVDISVKLNASGDQPGSLDADVGGPYQGADGGVPQFDFSADINVENQGQNQSFKGGLVSSGDAVFLKIGDTAYKVDEATYKNFAQLFASLQSQDQPDQPSILNPSGFLTDLKNEGTEDVEGTKTVHVSGKVDVNKLVDQIQAAPGAKKNAGAQLDQLRTSVQSASMDVFSGEDDKRLRKIDINAIFTPPPDQTGGEATTINGQFTLTFSDLGQDQTIEAPTSSEPLQKLLDQLRNGGGSLGQVLGGSGFPSGAGADTGDSGGPSAPDSGDTDPYLACLNQAKGQDALQDCIEQYQQ